MQKKTINNNNTIKSRRRIDEIKIKEKIENKDKVERHHCAFEFAKYGTNVKGNKIIF